MKALLLLVLVAVPLAAQKPVAAVAGTVTDGTRPIAEAIVEVFGTKLSRVTGADGAFRFDSLKPGPHWIKVRRIGYAPITFTTTLIANDTRHLDVELEATAYQLPDIQVQGGMTKWRFNEFQWRKSTAWGKFFTRDDIAQIRPYDLIALVQRGLPFATRFDLESANWEPPPLSTGGASYGQPVWQASSFRGSACPPAISFNGASPWPGYSLRDFQLEDVEAVEVYRARHVPIGFQNGQLGGCGLVVVWLK